MRQSADDARYRCSFCGFPTVVVVRDENGTRAECRNCLHAWHYRGQLSDETALLNFDSNARPPSPEP